MALNRRNNRESTEDNINIRVKAFIAEILEASVDDFEDIFEGEVSTDSSKVYGLEYNPDELDHVDIDMATEIDPDIDIDIEDMDTAEFDFSETGEDDDFDDDPLPQVRSARRADIEFHIENENVMYKINLGSLAFFRIDISKYQDNKNDYIPESPVVTRLESLTIVAEFLIKHQRGFLMAPDIKTAFTRLKSNKRKDLTNVSIR